MWEANLPTFVRINSRKSLLLRKLHVKHIFAFTTVPFNSPVNFDDCRCRVKWKWVEVEQVPYFGCAASRPCHFETQIHFPGQNVAVLRREWVKL